MHKALFLPLQLFLGTFSGLYTSSSLAQVTPDGTVNTEVNQNGNVSEIRGGEARGDNLFHSFEDFSVGTGNEAAFLNGNDISNIFSRVTGGNISNIDGLIRANGSASLFLINPNGIILGENARLDIGGSFYGSSASSILFEDGEFSAVDNLEQPLLTVNAPIGLNFRDDPGDITVRGDGNGARLVGSEVIDTEDALRVGANATIGFIGGNVLFEDATVKTPGGRIEIGSVSEGTVSLIAVDNGFTFDYSAIETFQDIFLSASSSIDGSGLGGGDINVAGNNISLTGVSAIEANTLGDQVGGDINIFAADSIEISGVENELNFVSGISNRTFANGTASAGDININTGSLSIGDRGLISTSVLGEGNAGNININASDAVTLASQGNTSRIVSGVNGGAVGNGGNIDITSSSLTISDRGSLNAASIGDGSAGNIIINANDDVSLTNSANLNVFGAGGGSVTINARNLELTTGSEIFSGINADVAIDNAQAGNITINTSEDISIDAAGGELTIISNSNFGIGNPGDIELNARNISLINGGGISSFNDGQGSTGNILVNATEDIVFDGVSAGISGIASFSAAESSGIVGNIDLQAQNLTITNGAGVTSQVVGEITTGDININVDDTVSIDGSAEITTDTSSGFLASTISNLVFANGIGNAGNININTNNLFLSRNGNISASTLGLGNAGNIDINANLITIGEQGNPNIVPSSIDAQTLANAQGNGGNITIDTGSLLISDGGDIDVGIFGTGNGGNINITARDLISVDGTGLVNDDIQVSSGILADVSNSVGNAGNIEIDTTELSVTNGAFVSADVFGESTGNGGSVNIRASESVDVSSGGAIQAELFRESTGTGGNLSIDTRRLTVEDGGEISVTTFGEGNGGSLTITATESIQLSGTTEISRGGIFASALVNSGNGGDVNLATGDLTISDGAIITASNFSSLGAENGGAAPGSGEPGEITITANSISLSEQGSIQTATQSAIGEGANITLQVEENLTLQDEGLISAQAFNQGNGGNLSIDSGFIIAFPTNGNGNDIIANAEEGNGGNINLNATLLGIEEGFAAPGNSTNDIDASSQFSLDGNVTINNPDNNLIQGATDLPSNIIQAEQTTAQSCRADGNSTTQNGLTIAGKGGVQAAPDLPLNSLNVTVDGEINPISAIPEPINTSKGKIQPARGIKVTESGEISLVAYHTNNAGDRISPNTRNCGKI